MNIKNALFIFLALAFCGFCSVEEAAAQTTDSGQPPGLFLRSGTGGSGLVLPGNRYRRNVPVDVNFDLLGTIGQPAQTVILNLFDGTEFRARFERSNSNRLGSFSWIGKLEGVPLGDVVLVSTNGFLAGTISLPGATYQVRPAPDGHEIVELDQSAFPRELDPIQAPVSGNFAMDQLKAGADSCDEIQVLVAWSPEARAAAGGQAQIEALVALAVEETNASYANSGLTQRIELAHAMETNPGDAVNSFSSDLSALRALDDGRFDNVDEARETYLADAVALLIEDGQYCGLGYVNSSANYAFTVTARSCATGYYSFGHELGHNLGARHDWYADDCVSGSECPHDKGFVYLADRWRTVMAYNTLCSDTSPGTYCSRLPYWSNPDVDYGGTVPMGVASDGPADCVAGSRSPDPASCAADNRLAQNNRCDAFANFRVGKVGALDTLQVNSTGATGVNIGSSTGHGGSTNYSIPLPAATAVELVAPATHQLASFSGWSGCTSSSGTSCSVTMNGDVIVTASYILPQYDLQVNSTGAAAVDIDSVTGHAGTTDYGLVLNAGTNVSLSAPLLAGGLSFVQWTRCTSSTNSACEVYLDGNFTVTAEYADGSCADGLEEKILYQEDMESSATGWVHSTALGPDTWLLDDSDANSPATSWRGLDVAEISDQRLVTPAVTIPANAQNSRLYFHHKYGIEANEDNTTCWDGAILEYSTDGGAGWSRIENSRLLSQLYTATVSEGFSNPIGGQDAWCGDLDWSEAVVDLAGFEGASVMFRYRLGTDVDVEHTGWRIDDFRVQACVLAEILLLDGFEAPP